jgi:hypothetical protein
MEAIPEVCDHFNLFLQRHLQTNPLKHTLFISPGPHNVQIAQFAGENRRVYLAVGRCGGCVEQLL